ncbi:NAD(P)-binding protein [Xylariaceae sp. FL0804]|nr:NAD(P)-binding protein [Xylariaceae sp. FL0804]
MSLKARHMRMVVPILVGKMAERYLRRSPSSSLTLTTGGAAHSPSSPGWSLMACLLAGLDRPAGRDGWGARADGRGTAGLYFMRDGNATGEEMATRNGSHLK